VGGGGGGGERRGWWGFGVGEGGLLWCGGWREGRESNQRGGGGGGRIGYPRGQIPGTRRRIIRGTNMSSEDDVKCSPVKMTGPMELKIIDLGIRYTRTD